MDYSHLNRLPQDTIHLIFSHLPLRQIIICRSLCKSLNSTLSSPSFIHLISTQQPPLSLIALRPSHRHVSSNPTIDAFELSQNQWLRFPLSFLLPFRSHHPITSSNGLIYLWAESNSSHSAQSNKSLVICNPLTQSFRVLPQLGSAWSRHGSVLVGSPNKVLLLTELAALYYAGGSNNWLKFSSNLQSKPRSPILVSDSIFALCDVGSPWRSQWKLFTITLSDLRSSHPWTRLEKHEWRDVFSILKRPRLVKGTGSKILMIGGLKSSFSLNAAVSTILILRLDLERMEWDEAGRMPLEKFIVFQESSKFKVFGGGNKVCFSAKRVNKLLLWDYEEEKEGNGEWRWINDVPGNGDGLCRGFVFEAQLTASHQNRKQTTDPELFLLTDSLAEE